MSDAPATKPPGGLDNVSAILIWTPRTLTLDQFIAEAKAAYGGNSRDWKVVCPRCATIMNGTALKAAGGRADQLGVTCIGSYDKELGCDFAANGLITAPWKVTFRRREPTYAFPLATVLTKEYHDQFPQTGYGETVVLANLEARSPLTAHEVADHLGVHVDGVQHSLELLEALGLVRSGLGQTSAYMITDAGKKHQRAWFGTGRRFGTETYSGTYERVVYDPARAAAGLPPWINEARDGFYVDDEVDQDARSSAGGAR